MHLVRFCVHDLMDSLSLADETVVLYLYCISQADGDGTAWE